MNEKQQLKFKFKFKKIKGRQCLKKKHLCALERFVFCNMATDTVAQVPYEYGHVILFSWNPDTQLPFKIFAREAVPEIPDNFIAKKLSIDARKNAFTTEAVIGTEVSLFVKLQKSKQLYI